MAPSQMGGTGGSPARSGQGGAPSLGPSQEGAWVEKPRRPPAEPGLSPLKATALMVRWAGTVSASLKGERPGWLSPAVSAPPLLAMDHPGWALRPSPGAGNVTAALKCASSFIQGPLLTHAYESDFPGPALRPLFPAPGNTRGFPSLAPS